MTPDELLGAALEVAEAGLADGELPIGAVVVLGDDIVGRAYTRDRGLGRRLAHADVAAMIEADEALGWRPRPYPVRLAVTLEPCVMCLGAAMSLRVDEVYYGLEAPDDGGVAVLSGWRPGPGMDWYRLPPVIVGGVRRDECRDLYRRYCETAPGSGFLDWARRMAREPAGG